MAIIEPQRRDIEHPDQRKRYSSSLRFWHWLNAAIISGSLLTVLLNSTVLDSHDNAGVIRENLKGSGVTVTEKQAWDAAHELSDKVWAVHTYFGYALVALVLFRLVMEFFQLADQRFTRGLKKAYRDYYIIKQRRELAKHEFWVKTIYAVFYLMIIVMAITGLCLAFEDDVPLLNSIHSIREIHGFTMYLILAFIAVHLAGVFLAERKDSPGIVSDMINGGKEGVL